MGVVTRGGDGGFTGLPGTGKTGRVRKDDPLIECLGALDELDAFCALAEIELKSSGDPRNRNIIAEVREELFNVVMPAAARLFSAPLSKERGAPNCARLEQQIAELEQENSPQGFMRTWTKPAAAALNAARAICRRAERRMTAASFTYVKPAESAPGLEDAAALLPWLNRLSDLLFLLAVSEERR